VPGPFDQFIEEAGAFERLALSQEPCSPQHYDGEYFQADWREEHNRYELETRRRVEDRNPALIVEALSPRRLLDVGCGPGFLMQFLFELGVDVHGVDFAPASIELAPPEMKERIDLGPTDDLRYPSSAFDVVVCREVLEHLTVLQVRRTVAEMCRVSSRYVYATTRFHPEPTGILDVTTDFETDPTHITLLTKSFLRTLFVLEGFARRADLEARLDWAGKGRVLVYERRSPDRSPGSV
jgi:2-polyprenyl-3-methyl-5-hydroxy-6-metoxy-1,4-benzoquinol methylase